jgi:hypothetical protein
VIRDGRRLYWPSGRISAVLSRRELPGDYGFHAPVSNRDWDDLNGQFADAIEFLGRNRDVLLRLHELQPREASLDFPAETDPSEKHVVIYDVTIPVELSRASAEVGIAVEITLYFSGDGDGGEPDGARGGASEDR